MKIFDLLIQTLYDAYNLYPQITIITDSHCRIKTKLVIFDMTYQGCGETLEASLKELTKLWLTQYHNKIKVNPELIKELEK